MFKHSRNHHQSVQCMCSVIVYNCTPTISWSCHTTTSRQAGCWPAQCPGWVGNRTALQNRSAKVMFERLLVTQCNVTGNFSYQVTSGPEKRVTSCWSIVIHCQCLSFVITLIRKQTVSLLLRNELHIMCWYVHCYACCHVWYCQCCCCWW